MSAYHYGVMQREIYTNANILTRQGAFKHGALLIEGGRIARVHDENDPAPCPADNTVQIDLNGKYIISGFVDAHFHISSLALKSLRCDLGGARSAAEAMELLAQWPGRGDARVLMGVDWDESRWKDAKFPTKEMLDRIDSNRPVFVRRICSHVGVVNTAFAKILEVAGVTVDKMTGVIVEENVYAANKMSLPGDSAIVDSYSGAIAKLHRLGVTGVHDIIETDRFPLYVQGIQKVENPIRIKGYLTTAPGKFDGFREAALSMEGEFFELMGVKLFLDGSIGGWTAALNEPYEDSPGSGDLLLSEDKLSRIMKQCHERSIGCAIHTIGDRALRTVLRILSGYPSGTRGFRIEHAELIGLQELRLLERAPVYIAMQPNFIRNWGAPGGLYETKLGKGRLALCNRFRALLDAGIGYCFSSDGMPPGPLYGLKGAIEHPVAAERISPVEALLHYTVRAHELSGSPAGHGLLEAGSPADFVVLSGDPLTDDPDDLRVLRTTVAGRSVFEANDR